MTCTDSTRDSGSGLDHLLKNAEFENVQQTKAIKTERETIQVYEHQLEEKARQTTELEKSILDLDELAKKLHKQFTFSRDNYESLRRTSTVLADHEEALKRKLYATQKEVEQESVQQSNALAKYSGIWATYQAKYDSMEKVRELRQEQEEIQLLNQQDADLEKQIRELQERLKNLEMEKGMRETVSMRVVQIAKLRVDSTQELQQVREDRILVDDIQVGINNLQGRIVKAETQLEIALQLQQQKKASQDLLETTGNEVMDTDSGIVPVKAISHNSLTTTSVIDQSLSKPTLQLTLMPSHKGLTCPNTPTNTTHSVADITPPTEIIHSSNPQQNTLQKSIPSLISLPQVQPRTLSSSPRSHSQLNGSPISSSRYRLAVPTLSIPQRVSGGTKPSHPSVNNQIASLSTLNQTPPQSQRFIKLLTTPTGTSPLITATTARTQAPSSSSKSQLTLQTPTRPSTASSLMIPKHVAPPSLLKPTTTTTTTTTPLQFVQVPKSNLHKEVPVQDQQSANTHTLSRLSVPTKESASVLVPLKTAASVPVTLTNKPSATCMEEHNTYSNTVPVRQSGQQEQVDNQAMDADMAASSVAGDVSLQRDTSEQIERSRVGEENTTNTATSSSTYAQQEHTMEIGTGHSDTMNTTAVHEGATAHTTAMEQLPDMFALQDSANTNNTNPGPYSEPNASASVGNHGYSMLQLEQSTGGPDQYVMHTTGGSEEEYQNQPAFGSGEQQMMLPVGDNMQFYETGNEGNFGGDFFNFDSSASGGFSFGAPLGTPSSQQGDNSGFAFSFGGSSTPASGGNSSFFNF